MPILDHTQDTGGVELHRLAKLYPLPDFVKSASVDKTLHPVDLNANEFADPRDGFRNFPCHNPASTWLSTLFFAEKQGSYNLKEAARVRQSLDGYAKYWNIKAAVDAIWARHKELTKCADDTLPDSDFAVVYALENGTKERHCRMKNAAEVKAAAGWLAQHRDALPFHERHVIAKKVQEKAARYGADLGANETFIDRQVGLGICHPPAVVQMLQDRARLAKTAAQKDAMTKLAQVVVTQPRAALDPSTLLKLAETIDGYDRALHLQDAYSDVIPRSEDVLFGITLREARASIGDAVALTTTRVYDRKDFQKLALQDLRDLFGKDFASSVAAGLEINTEKLAEIVPTLARPDAELFERALQEAGIPPILNKSGADMRMAPGMLDALAAGYRP